MKVFGILCLACILAVASSQSYAVYTTADCSGDTASKVTMGECIEAGDEYQKSTRVGDCKKGMKVETQKYKDKDCTEKEGDATESELDMEVDKCIDHSTSQKVGTSWINTTMSSKVDCSPASVKTFMPIMTAFAIVVSMFSQ